MKRLIAFLCFGYAAGAFAADPYIGYLYPAGMQTGTTNRVIVGGQFFWNIKGGCVSGNGVKVLDVELVPGFTPPTGDQRRYLVTWLDAIAKGDRTTPPIPNVAHLNEWRRNAWWSVLGGLDDLKLSLVAHFLYTPRNPLQMSPSLSQKLLVTVAADRDAVPGVRELRVYGPAGMSEPRPFIVSAAPHLAETIFSPPHRALPPPPTVRELPVVLDGQIMPGTTDLWRIRLQKDRTVTFRTVAREFQPYIGDAVPGFFNATIRLLDHRGNEVAFADDNFYHPDPVLIFTPPADGDYTLAIHDVLYRGREDFVYQITLQEGACPVDPRADGLWPTAVHEATNAFATVCSGVIDRPGAVTDHEFEIVEQGDYTVDLLARRAGSPLDAAVTLFRAGEDEPFAVMSDVTNTVHRGAVIQAECDPVATLRFEKGKYHAQVTDEAGLGGSEWTYSLRIHAPQPSFEVWAAKSSLTLRPRNGMKLKLNVLRSGGFTGEVRLDPTPFFRFAPPVIPAASNTVSVWLAPTYQFEEPPTNLVLSASADIDGVPTRVCVQPADEYNQAFAWDHLLPARSFWLKAWGPPRPPPKKANPGNPTR